MYWKAGQKILCAARMIARDPRLFGLYVTNFACGPDSYLVKFFSKETEGKPFLTIEIDEHSADAGIITRCEAFIDTIRNARTRGTSKYIPLVSISSNHTNSRRVYVPYMIDHGYLLAAAMRHGGVDAEPLPESDELTLEIGRKYTTGKECYPSIITTGDIVKKTMAPDFDADHAAFFMPAASGPCRFGQYNRLHRLILDELGLQQVPILVFDQTGGYHKDLASMGQGFRLNAWRAFVILDSMQKMVLERRPYEVNKGETDAVYKEWLDRLIKNVGQDGARLRSVLAAGQGGFRGGKNRYELRPSRASASWGRYSSGATSSPTIGLIRKLEALGAQCGVPPLEEWLDYIDHQRKRRNRLHLEGGWRDWTKQKLTEIVMERIAEPLRKQFDSSIEAFTRELPTQAILEPGAHIPDAGGGGRGHLEHGASGGVRRARLRRHREYHTVRVHAGDDSEPAAAPVPPGLRPARAERGGGGDERPRRVHPLRGVHTAVPGACAEATRQPQTLIFRKRSEATSFELFLDYVK